MSENKLYDSHRARLDTVLGGNVEFYAGLKQARDLWSLDHADQPVEDFLLYLEDTYGIQMSQCQGDLDTEYRIVDEKKYLLFVLKFS